MPGPDLSSFTESVFEKARLDGLKSEGFRAVSDCAFAQRDPVAPLRCSARTFRRCLFERLFRLQYLSPEPSDLVGSRINAWEAGKAWNQSLRHFLGSKL